MDRLNPQHDPGLLAPAGRRADRWLWLAGLAMALCLLARILNAPVSRDEQIFFSVSLLAGAHDLYSVLGFNHLPNLPLLTGPLLQAADRPFLVARLIVFVAWLASLGLIGVHALRETGSRALAGLSLLLLASSPLLLNETGTLFSNNLLPVPFALAGVILFLRAVEADPPDARRLLAAGVLLAFAAGLKANYLFVIVPVGVAALLMPARLSPGQRLLHVAGPLLVGGVIGGAPTLIRLARDPQGLLAHVVGYHTGPHRAQAAASSEDLVISLGDRILLARQLWGDGGTLLTGFLCVLLVLLLLRQGWRPGRGFWLLGAIILLGAVMGLVPTPSFPQYFSLPVPFLILMLLLLAGALEGQGRALAAPALLALGLMVLAVDGPRLARDLPKLARPAMWVPMKVHDISRQVVAATGAGPVVTLSPVYVLEAGGRIYPELAGGPFVYRVAHLIPAAQRPYYRAIVGPDNLAAFLAAAPPAGVLVGEHGPLDDALRAHAARQGMRPIPLAGAATRYGQLELFVADGR
jgi:hypothetical protein